MAENVAQFEDPQAGAELAPGVATQASKATLTRRAIGLVKFLAGATAITLGFGLIAGAISAGAPPFFDGGLGGVFVVLGFPLLAEGSVEFLTGKKHKIFLVPVE